MLLTYTRLCETKMTMQTWSFQLLVSEAEINAHKMQLCSLDSLRCKWFKSDFLYRRLREGGHFAHITVFSGPLLLSEQMTMTCYLRTLTIPHLSAKRGDNPICQSESGPVSIQGCQVALILLSYNVINGKSCSATPIRRYSCDMDAVLWIAQLEIGSDNSLNICHTSFHMCVSESESEKVSTSIFYFCH